MTTYVYETILSKPGQKPRFLEIKQSMKDAPLTQHPETGDPIRRVILGGFGVLHSGEKTKSTAPAGGCGCGPGGCCN